MMAAPGFKKKTASTPAEVCQALIAQARSGKISPCYLFLGEFPVTAEYLETLTSLLVDEGSADMNLQELSGEEASPGKCVEFLETLSFFPGRKVLVVKDPMFLQSSSTVSTRWKSVIKAIEKQDTKRAARMLSQLMGLFKITASEIQELEPDQLRTILKWPSDLASSEDAVSAIKDFLAKEGSQIMPAATGDSGSAEILIRWLNQKADPARSVLLIQTETADKRGSVFKAIKEQGAVIDFTVSGNARQARQLAASTVREHLSRHGIVIEPRALDLLFELVGENNIPALLKETEKLVSGTGSTQGKKRKITPDDIKRIVSHQREEEIFKLTGAIARQDAAAALGSLNLILDQGIHPLQVMGGLNNFLKSMLAITAAAAATTGIPALNRAQFQQFRQRLLPELETYFKDSATSPFKGHPYALFMQCKSAGAMSIKRIITLLRRMPEIDLELKGGAVSPRLVLEMLVMDMAGGDK